MRDATIARAYAGALLELGSRHGEAEAYAAAFRQLRDALGTDGPIARFLETPRIDVAAKQAAVRKSFQGKAPERFVRFLLVVIAKRRQGLLAEIQGQYEQLLDEQAGRIHAEVTLAREPDAALERVITERLSSILGKTVEPRFTVNPAIVGGLVVRFGDRVLDGSIRRQLVSLRREMMHAGLPALPAVSA